MHIEHEAGRQVFVDFAGDRPVLTDEAGHERAVELFVAVYPASGLVYAEATENQRVASLVGATAHTFEYAGGAPAFTRSCCARTAHLVGAATFVYNSRDLAGVAHGPRR